MSADAGTRKRKITTDHRTTSSLLTTTINLGDECVGQNTLERARTTHSTTTATGVYRCCLMEKQTPLKTTLLAIEANLELALAR